MPESRDKHAPIADQSEPAKRRARIRLGGYSIAMPGSRRQRVILGSGLVGGGVLGFLPILGFWMIPLGLMVLSVDSPRVRSMRRKLEVRWGRWRQSKAKPKAADKKSP